MIDQSELEMNQTRDDLCIHLHCQCSNVDVCRRYAILLEYLNYNYDSFQKKNTSCNFDNKWFTSSSLLYFVIGMEPTGIFNTLYTAVKFTAGTNRAGWLKGGAKMIDDSFNMLL